MNKLNISTNDLINKLPVGFQLSNSELKLIEVLESDLNIPLKQIEIFKIQQKRFLIDIETDLTTDDILKSKATSVKKEDINKIIQALTILMKSDKNIGQPYYYLLKSWFDDQLKREYLASLVFSMIQVGLKQQRRAYNDDINEATVSEANFIYQVGKAFLNTFLQLELAFRRQEIAKSSKDLSESNRENFDEIEDKVVFKYNKFSIQTAIKHIGRRNMRLASQKKDLRLTPDELSSIDEEIKHLKQMREELKRGNFSALNKTVPELTQLTVSKLKLAYGFIRLKDQLDLGNTIVDLLRELGYITITNRDGKTSTIGLAPYLLKRYVW